MKHKNSMVVDDVVYSEDKRVQVSYPEGVVTTEETDLRECGRVFIPSTLENLWLGGLKGPAPNLYEFVVCPENEEYRSLGGHLYSGNNLLMYCPGTDNRGVIPEGTEKISPLAFKLIPSPIETLYIPASLREICLQNLPSGWFYNVEVSPDNPCFKAIDGSLYSADGRTLVRAGTTADGFVVPQGVEVICDGAFQNVSGDITIPDSVKEIFGEERLGCEGVEIITPRASYADDFILGNKYTFSAETTYNAEFDEKVDFSDDDNFCLLL